MAKKPIYDNSRLPQGEGLPRYEIWSETRQIHAAQGLSTMVAHDYEANKSIVIPERWREIITAYEVVAPTGG